MRPSTASTIGGLDISFIHSFSQQECLGFLLGVLCNVLHGVEVLMRYISVFQGLVGRGTGLHTSISNVTVKGSYIMVQKVPIEQVSRVHETMFRRLIRRCPRMTHRSQHLAVLRANM